MILGHLFLKKKNKKKISEDSVGNSFKHFQILDLLRRN